MYNINDLYFGTIETLRMLFPYNYRVLFADDFETGIFVINKKETKAVNLLDDKKYLIFQLVNSLKHPILSRKITKSKGKKLVHEIYPLTDILKKYNIDLKKEDLSLEELTELNNKLYGKVVDDYNSIKREKDKKTNNDSELTM